MRRTANGAFLGACARYDRFGHVIDAQIGVFMTFALDVVNVTFRAFFAIIGGNLMPPPKLARYTPIANVVHPIEKGLFPEMRRNARFPRFDGFDSGLGEDFCIDPPLREQKRFDECARTLTARRCERIIDDLHQKPCLFEIGNSRFAARLARHAAVFFGHGIGHLRIEPDNLDSRQIVAFSRFKVCKVVRRRNLDGARSKCRIGC